LVRASISSIALSSAGREMRGQAILRAVTGRRSLPRAPNLGRPAGSPPDVSDVAQDMLCFTSENQAKPLTAGRPRQRSSRPEPVEHLPSSGAAGYSAAVSQENVELVRRMQEAFVGAQPEMALSFLHPHVVYDARERPDGRVWRGREEIAGAMLEWSEVWDDREVEVERYVDAGEDQVLILWHERGRGKESGIVMDRRGASPVTIVEGRTCACSCSSTSVQRSGRWGWTARHALPAPARPPERAVQQRAAIQRRHRLRGLGLTASYASRLQLAVGLLPACRPRAHEV
jgi:SnoaL-like domain